jgi:hypothetical protein
LAAGGRAVEQRKADVREITRGAATVLAVRSWYEFISTHHLVAFATMTMAKTMAVVAGHGLVSIGSGSRKLPG